MEITTPAPWKLRGHSFNWGDRTYLMGILNVTPDSFSDGGDFYTLDTALTEARRQVAAGADIIDVGGQSTRPGSTTISLNEELDRVIPLIQQMRCLDACATVPISVDTTRSAVAREAIAAGADLVNDISGGTFDSGMLPAVASLGVPIILMHLRGTPQTMQQLTEYDDLIDEIYRVLDSQIKAALAAGIERSNLIIDPGIGFAKTSDQNLEILRKIPEFRSLGVPVLIGPSRKSFIGHILNRPETKPKQRVWGTAAACVAAIAGGADLLRVHDVPQMYDVCRVADAIFRSNTSFQKY